MSRTAIQLSADRRSAKIRRDLAEQLVRLMDDAGLPERALASAAGLPQSYVCRILAGDARPSPETYARLGAALGADYVARFYPNTGPPIRDRHQARMLEHQLATLHPRWDRTPEAIVTRPARGVIDLVLHDPAARVLVADEVQSELRRLEQLIRWHRLKAESLPSWQGFEPPADGGEPRISRLLVVRRTRATRAVASEFAAQLRAAYPAHPADAVASLAGEAPWPGDSLVWIALDATGARFCDDR